MTQTAFEIRLTDPRSLQAAALIAALTYELSERYDFEDDGSGQFKPEDATGPGSAFVVGWLGDRPIACGAYKPLLPPGVAELKRMYVVPNCRGRGYASAMLTEIERLAIAAGYTVMRLETGFRQPEAIHLYARMGYVRIPNFGIYADKEASLCFEKVLVAASAHSTFFAEPPSQGFSV